MFTWEAVDSFIRTEGKRLTPYGRRLYRTVLRRVVDTVHGPRGVHLNRAELGRIPDVRPYTAAEEQAFRLMISNQKTEHRRLNGEVLLGLAFGAGLTTGEIGMVRGHDIVRVDDGVEVHVPGERARIVPVFSEWDSVLLAAAERTGAGRAFLPNHQRFESWSASAFIKLLEGKPTDLQAQRMRATWILRLLDGGIRANVLVAMTGTAEANWIGRYVPLMAPVARAEAHASIRALSRPSAEAAA